MVQKRETKRVGHANEWVRLSISALIADTLPKIFTFLPGALTYLFWKM